MLVSEHNLLHGIAAAIGVSKFLHALFYVVLILFITRINRINSLQISGIFEFGFLDSCSFLL